MIIRATVQRTANSTRITFVASSFDGVMCVKKIRKMSDFVWDHILPFLSNVQKERLPYTPPEAYAILFCDLLNNLLDSGKISKEIADDIYNKTFVH
jgi:hypothetical protein